MLVVGHRMVFLDVVFRVVDVVYQVVGIVVPVVVEMVELRNRVQLSHVMCYHDVVERQYERCRIRQDVFVVVMGK